jgi:hypothetical protein
MVAVAKDVKINQNQTGLSGSALPRSEGWEKAMKVTVFSHPMFIRIREDQTDTTGTINLGLVRADQAKLADWLTAAKVASDDQRPNIQRVIELARSQDFDPELPIIPQIWESISQD